MTSFTSVLCRKIVQLALALLLALGLCLVPHRAAAQAIDLEATRQPISNIASTWRFHPGDDPRWSQPDFDDSGWKPIASARNWSRQGYSEQNGLAWFRFKLRVPANTSSLLLQLPLITKSYQLFAGGRLIAEVGNLPPAKPRAVTGAARIFTLPLTPSANPQTVTVALRLWQEPWLVGISPNVLRGPAYAGEAATIMREFSLAKNARLLTKGGEYTEDIIAVIAGAASLFLFWFTRQRLYLWFAAFSISLAAGLPVHLISEHFAWSYLYAVYLYMLIDVLVSVSLAFFIFDILQQRGFWPRLFVVAAALLADVSLLLLILGKTNLIWANAGYFIFNFLITVVLLYFLVRGWRSGTADIRVLLVTYAITGLVSDLGSLGHWLVSLNVPHAESLLVSDIEVLQQPFTISVEEVGTIIFLLGMLAVLVYRFARTSRDQQRLATALQAAHDIQYDLVPVDLPSLGGLQTAIAYLAAEEVGGDFCQVLPRVDGSILVAIGDVSGKGLQAAMLGTLAVGALRSMAQEALDPAAILERLNHVVLRTGHTGFTTCLCLNVQPDGGVTLANAGHLSPYLNGEELNLEPGLPLGLVPGARYQSIFLRLPSTARLTLLSDGVVEARSETGELFGFERTSNVSQLAASQIAAQARQHGQEDDITIITLDWNAPTAAIAAA